MSWYVVDCESDGPIPVVNSMVCFGAVKVDDDLATTFYGKTRPISEEFNPEALAISGFSREQHMLFDDPIKVMTDFEAWIKETTTGKPIMVSDNIAYDWQWINYYFWKYLKHNVFGYSGRRIGDLWCGMQKDTFSEWKHLRDAPANHNPVSDALGNAQALIKMKAMGLRIPK